MNIWTYLILINRKLIFLNDKTGLTNVDSLTLIKKKSNI